MKQCVITENSSSGSILIHPVGLLSSAAIREELGTRTFLVVLERELMCGRISRRAKTYALYLILEQDFEKVRKGNIDSE